MPLSVLSDIGFALNDKVVKRLSPNSSLARLLPQSGSIKLSLLSDYAIKGALGKLDTDKTIWTNEEMNKHIM